MVRADYAVGVKGVGFDQQKKLALQRHEFERKRNSIGDIAEDSAAWDNAEVIAQAALLEQAAAPAILGSTVNYGDQLSTPRSPIYGVVGESVAAIKILMRLVFAILPPAVKHIQAKFSV